VKWISTPAFQANLKGVQGRGEGANNSEGARTVEEGGANGR
jgi:hypothetical protein